MIPRISLGKLLVISGLFFSIPTDIVWAESSSLSCTIEPIPHSSPYYFTSVKSALEANCQAIRVNGGTYNESFTLTEGRILSGVNPNKVTFTGIVTLENNTTIQGITIDRGGIIVTLDADTVINNVSVTNSLENGIETTGLGNLHLTASKIIHSAKKGLYLRWGKTIFIDDVLVQSNTEEGIDIHGNTTGYIINSKLENNGESGAEIIVADARILLSNNSFHKNAAHDIAFQYYPYIPEQGNIRLIQNFLQPSPDLGQKSTNITCKKSSGGKLKDNADYWEKSLSIFSNIESYQQLISKDCSNVLVNNIDRQEADKLYRMALEKFTTISIQEKKGQRELIEEKTISELQSISKEIELIFGEWQSIKESSGKPSFKRWLFGYSDSEQDMVKKLKKRSEGARLQTEALLQKTYNPQSRQDVVNFYQILSSKITTAEEMLDIMRQETGILSSFLSQKNK